MARVSQKDKLNSIKSSVESFYSANQHNIEEYWRSQDFVLNKASQWTAEESAYYEKHKRPKLTVNRLYMVLKQLISAQRASTVNLTIRPMASSFDSQQQESMVTQKIKLVENLVRSIGYHSDNDTVYQAAFRDACFGYGGWRIETEYESDDSFNQVTRLHAITDPTRLYWDPSAQDPLKIDGDFMGYKVLMSKSEYEKQYGSLNVDNLKTTDSIGTYTNNSFRWVEGETGKERVVVCHHFEKEYYTKKIALLSNGMLEEVCDADEVEETLLMLNEESPVPFELEKYRNVTTYQLMQYVISGEKIIDKRIWPGKLFPICIVEGDSYYQKDGKYVVLPYTKFAEDPQKLLNVSISNLSDGITRHRGERFKATPDSIPETAMKQWANPWDHEGVYFYNPTPEMPNGPEVMSSSEISPTLFTGLQSASGMINEVIGRGLSAQGQVGNEISGAAIDNRVRQDNENLGIHFDNLNRALEYSGKVILELIPKIYDNKRSVSTVDNSNQIQMEDINDPTQPHTMLTEDEFGIEVKPGPSFALQKEEVSQRLMDLIQADPQLMSIFGDKVVSNMDIPDADALADRMKVGLDPQIQELIGYQPPPAPPSPPDPSTQLQMADMQIKQAQLQQKERDIQYRTQKSQMEAELQLRDNQLRQQELEIEKLKVIANASNTNTKARADIISAMERH